MSKTQTGKGKGHMKLKKLKAKLLASLKAKAAAVGSSAKTITGMGKAVLSRVRPIKGTYNGRFNRQTSRSRWIVEYRGDRIIAKATKSLNYRLPKKADPVSVQILVNFRESQYREEIERTAKSALGRIRVAFDIDKIEKRLESSWPLRKSESAWAGGEHTVHVRLRPEPGCCGESSRVWSKNGKWSGTNSEATLYATLRALAHFPSLQTADGSIVLDAHMVGPREYRITWAGQARGVDLKPVTGWLIRGYHSERKTLAAARIEASEARSKSAAALLAKRQSRKALRSVYVSVDDSLHAGNCQSQTNAFAAQAWRQIGAVGPCAVRADLIISMRDDVFTRRAIGAAMAR